MENILLAIYGALWRWWDGRGKEVWPHINRTLVRLAVLVPAAIYTGWVITGGWWSIWVGAWMVLNLHLSPYKFMPSSDNQRSPFMILRYSTGAIITIAPGLFGYFTMFMDGAPYVIMCALAGLSYPILDKHASGKVHEYGAEVLVGAAVIGGLIS